MLDPIDMLSHAVSAAGGGLTVGWIAKVLIQGWLKRHTEMERALNAMLVQLTRIEEQVKNYARSEDRIDRLMHEIAVIQTRIAEMEGRR